MNHEEAEFISRIDARFPATCQSLARALIDEACSIGSNAAHMVALELARPPRDAGATPAQRAELLDFWRSRFRHPLAARSSRLARSCIWNERPSRSIVLALARDLRSARGEFNALQLWACACQSEIRLIEEGILEAWNRRASKRSGGTDGTLSQAEFLFRFDRAHPLASRTRARSLIREACALGTQAAFRVGGLVARPGPAANLRRAQRDALLEEWEREFAHPLARPIARLARCFIRGGDLPRADVIRVATALRTRHVEPEALWLWSDMCERDVDRMEDQIRRGWKRRSAAA